MAAQKERPDHLGLQPAELFNQYTNSKSPQIYIYIFFPFSDTPTRFAIRAPFLLDVKHDPTFLIFNFKRITNAVVLPFSCLFSTS